MSMLATPAAQVIGSQACERGPKYPCSTARSASSAVVQTALIGNPAPKCFETVIMSGTTSSCRWPHILPFLPQPGLRLVHNQQHAALVAVVLKQLHIPWRRHDDSSGAHDRLDDYRRRLSGQIRVRYFHA